MGESKPTKKQEALNAATEAASNLGTDAAPIVGTITGGVVDSAVKGITKTVIDTGIDAGAKAAGKSFDYAKGVAFDTGKKSGILKANQSEPLNAIGDYINGIAKNIIEMSPEAPSQNTKLK